MSGLINPPFVEVAYYSDERKYIIVYTLNSFVAVLNLLKLKFITTAFEYYSSWTDLRSKRITQNFGVTNKISFGIKSSLQTKPVITVAITFCASLFVMGYIIRIFERYSFSQR